MKDKRFEVIYSQGTFEQFKVVRDNETGVLYLQNNSGTGGGLTVMVDTSGRPLVDRTYQNQE
ncbi:MAG: DUF6440 family protein [Bacillota bacterium]